MRCEIRRQTELRWRRTWKLALIASLLVHLAAFVLLPPLRTFAAPESPPPVPEIVDVQEFLEPPPPPPEVRRPVIPIAALDESVADETIPDTVLDPGTAAPPPPPAPPSEGAFRVYDRAPSPRRFVKPEYPAIARQAGVEGAVVVRVTVDPTGRVTQAVVVRSDSSLLDGAALAAVREWLFTPAEQSGLPVRAVVEVRLQFRLGP